MPPPTPAPLPKKYENAWDLRPRDKHCVDCKWGDFEALGLPNKGLCRRHPPVPGWAAVHTHDWCSEFEQSKKAKKEADEIAAENP